MVYSNYIGIFGKKFSLHYRPFYLFKMEVFYRFDYIAWYDTYLNKDFNLRRCFGRHYIL